MSNYCKYVHTNIIAEDWKRLALFYTEVFGCEFVPPERNQSGQWLEAGTGVKGASLSGVHLRLPGHGDGGPTLEIYSYAQMEKAFPAKANRKGYSHIAFEVDNVTTKLEQLLSSGGSMIGEIVTRSLPHGELTFVYAADPEGNIIELQSWNK
jgi:predicted enzyme related to lactoylglutathione lyase